MQSAFQETFSYTIAVRDLLDGGLVIVRRMRASRWQMRWVLVAWYAFVTWDPDEDGWAFGLLCAQCEGSAFVL